MRPVIWISAPAGKECAALVSWPSSWVTVVVTFSVICSAQLPEAKGTAGVAKKICTGCDRETEPYSFCDNGLVNNDQQVRSRGPGRRIWRRYGSKNGNFKTRKSLDISQCVVWRPPVEHCVFDSRRGKTFLLFLLAPDYDWTPPNEAKKVDKKFVFRWMSVRGRAPASTASAPTSGTRPNAPATTTRLWDQKSAMPFCCARRTTTAVYVECCWPRGLVASAVDTPPWLPARSTAAEGISAPICISGGRRRRRAAVERTVKPREVPASVKRTPWAGTRRATAVPRWMRWARGRESSLKDPIAVARSATRWRSAMESTGFVIHTRRPACITVSSSFLLGGQGRRTETRELGPVASGLWGRGSWNGRPTGPRRPREDSGVSMERTASWLDGSRPASTMPMGAIGCWLLPEDPSTGSWSGRDSPPSSRTPWKFGEGSRSPVSSRPIFTGLPVRPPASHPALFYPLIMEYLSEKTLNSGEYQHQDKCTRADVHCGKKRIVCMAMEVADEPKCYRHPLDECDGNARCHGGKYCAPKDESLGDDSLRVCHPGNFF